MWVIENEGDLFGGKRFWLRPGKAHVIGRVVVGENEPVEFGIVDKTVSRKHLRVEVAPVDTSDYKKPNTRSKITLQDLNAKIGTLVDGEQIRGKTIELTNNQSVVQIARYSSRFIFTWIPVTFSFSFTQKQLGNGTLDAVFSTLGPLDIKALNTFEAGVTSHLIVNKRNTAKGLQALIDGKYIVQYDGYYKAVVTAATRPSPDIKSALEEDFNGNFPDPLQYLPPRGEEPTHRGEDAYAPNPGRKNMFEGYTFIFCAQSQFKTLLAPITEGGGKALLNEVVANETNINDFVRYVKSVAGEKGLGSFEDGSEGRGVVVVRYNPIKGDEQEIAFHNDFNRDVSLHLDHRLIEQNEFLDAILGVDASVLRRPLEMEASSMVAPPPTANTTNPTQHTLVPPVVLVAQATDTQRKKSRFRKTAAPKFKGFDSDDDDNPLDSIPESMQIDSVVPDQPESQGLFMTQDPTWEISRDTVAAAPSTATRSGRNRVPPPQPPRPPINDSEDSDQEENVMDRIAPAATALRHRKLAAEAARRGNASSSQTPVPSLPPAVKTIKESLSTSKKRKPSPEPAKPAKKIKKETDYAAAARQRVERAEELARISRDREQADLDGVDPEEIRKLTILETMEVRRPPPPARARRADESDRWDDSWNGRKNFKKFRRRGGEENGRPGIGASRVIVPLQHYKRKEYGVGEDYWLESEESWRRKATRERDTTQPSVVVSQTHVPSLAKSSSMAKSQSKSQSRIPDTAPPQVVEVRSSAEESDEEEPQAATRGRVAKMPVSQNSAPLKRGATTALQAAPRKKAKLEVPVDDSEDDSDDDGQKFRFGR